MDFADGQIGLGIDGAVATLELRRPEKRNAITQAMWRAFPEVAAALATAAGVRAVVLRGAGSEAFSAGADIEEFPALYATPEAARAANAAVRSGIDAVAGLPLPVLALVRGPCIGGGLALALAADLRLAATDARFGLPPARLGLAYPYPDTAALVRLVGPARAKELLFSARVIGAEEALRIGLVERVVAPGALDGEVQAEAEAIAALSPASVALAKRMVAAACGGAAEAPPELGAAFEAIFAGPDLAEGTRAFLERRRPRFG